MSAPRRVLHVVSGYLPGDAGGTQLHLRDLCRAQGSFGWEPVIFTRQDGEGPEFEIQRDEFEGVPVHRLRNNFLDVDRFSLLFEHPGIDAKFVEVLEECRPDLVHVHHLTCLSCSILREVKERGLPLVMTLHDYWLQCPRGQRIRPEDLEICTRIERKRCLPCLRRLWPHLLPGGDPQGGLLGRIRAWFHGPGEAEENYAWREAFVKRMLDLCDATIAPSRFHRDRFLEWGLDGARCRFIEHGLPREGLEAPPHDCDEVRHIGFLGSVIPSKGVHVLVEACKRLEREGIVLDIHGELLDYHGDRGYGDRLRELAGDDIELRLHGGYRSGELPGILKGLDLLVVPSIWWETFCLTAREGALAGLPVVAGRLGGVGEAVEQGLALGFEAGNAGDLARVLERLCGDRELRREMAGKGGLVRSIEECAAETCALYEELRARAGG